MPSMLKINQAPMLPLSSSPGYICNQWEWNPLSQEAAKPARMGAQLKLAPRLSVRARLNRIRRTSAPPVSIEFDFRSHFCAWLAHFPAALVSKPTCMC